VPGVPSFARFASHSGQARHGRSAGALSSAPTCPPKPEGESGNSRRWGRPRQCQRATRLRQRRRRTEYPANGSLTEPLHAAFLRAFALSPAAFQPPEKNYGQASRLISIGKLNVSPRLHTRPITWSSSRSLQGSCDPGRSHLVEGFTLRCLQRFSLPDVATRRCRWRDNRYTRGPSNPVLSY
jgi:hypothetical protein